MAGKWGVIDLFAGPGGLSEGFSPLMQDDGDHAVEIALSIEKEPTAFCTLLLRSFIRRIGENIPKAYIDFLSVGPKDETPFARLLKALLDERFGDDWPPEFSAFTRLRATQRLDVELSDRYEEFSEAFARCLDEVHCLTLGEEECRATIESLLDRAVDCYGDKLIVIGGPPCQAYSLVGRARNAGIADYVPELDNRHYLYKAYVEILQRVKPALFVMENVKGMLSSTLDGKRIFHSVLADLEDAAPGGYSLFGLDPRSDSKELFETPEPSDFLIRAEEYGVPQARHRVIIVGVRRALLDEKSAPWHTQEVGSEKASVLDVLQNMPPLRSGISKGSDSLDGWVALVSAHAGQIRSKLIPPSLTEEQHQRFVDHLDRTIRSCEISTLDREGRGAVRAFPNTCPPDLARWLEGSASGALPNNETRGHMEEDLGRYLFAACFAASTGRSPKASEYPDELKPRHANWDSGKFADRFRVQIGDRPATTVTSHISKDGHYFIHPDPTQVRSLTVREAARLQTFPDDYYFMGNRTQQYVQVGNAVPPFLAKQIATRLIGFLERTGQTSIVS